MTKETKEGNKTWLLAILQVIKCLVTVVFCVGILHYYFTLPKFAPAFVRQFMQNEVSLLALCLISMAIMAWFHSKGIFAFFSVTDDAERMNKHMYELLSSDNVNCKMNIKRFRFAFGLNILVISSYVICSFLSKSLGDQLSGDNCADGFCAVLLTTTLLVIYYIKCVKSKVFLPREYTMKNRDRNGKTKLLWFRFAEFNMRALFIALMVYPLIPLAGVIYNYLWIGILLLLVVFWIWYLAQRDMVYLTRPES